MPGIGDPADQLRVALGVPGEHEERPLDAARVAELEHPLGIADDTALVAVPGAEVDGFLEVRDLVPVLDVHGERVDHRRPESVSSPSEPAGIWAS